MRGTVGWWRPAALLAVLLAACSSGEKATGPQVQNPGTLAITIQGLPGGVSARVTVNGPGGYQRSVTSSQQLTGLTPGTYTIDALFVTSGPQTFNASPASASVQVQANAVAQYTVTYAPAAATNLNLLIGQVTLIQSVQRDDGTVPMVENRDAYLRVYVIASQANSAAPQVRVRFYNGATLVDTRTIPAPSGSVPTQINQGQLSASWNLLVPATLVQGNLTLQVDVDPSNAVAENNESDNVWPAQGSQQAVQVLDVTPLGVRFVPVRQAASNLTGNVNQSNQDAFLDLTRRMHPIGAWDTDLHATYSTNAPVLQSDNANNAWGTVLSEIRALQTAEQSTRNYYGVVQTTYTSGVAGIGYIGAPAALGWDRSSSISNIAAHELGHNFGRSHAPCGVSPFDPNYPYAGAVIGVYGLDVASLSVKAPTVYKDIMSYCSPDWISDYTYEAVLNFRGTLPAVWPSQGSLVTGLLVWGRIVGDSVILEPAFQVIAAPVLPLRAGRYRLRGSAADGRTLVDLSFEGDVVADLPGRPERHFAFIVPLDAASAGALSTLRVTGPRGAAIQRARVLPTAGVQPFTAPAPSAQAAGAGRVRLTWDGVRYPMMLVRDPRSGEILSFARGGSAEVWTDRTDLRVELSNGVGSLDRQVVVGQQ